MIDYPEWAEVDNVKYKINTDYRVALRCNDIAKDVTISDEERALAIIFLLFGDEGIKSNEHYNDLLVISLKYLKFDCDNETEDYQEKANMDIKQDWSYIQASFFSEYRIDLSETKLHWWKFWELLCGLSDKCILNRVRFIRDLDLSEIKDDKEREKWAKQKDLVKLKEEEKIDIEKIRLDELFEKQLKGE